MELQSWDFITLYTLDLPISFNVRNIFILLLLLKVSLTRHTILNQQFFYIQYFEGIILLILDFQCHCWEVVCYSKYYTSVKFIWLIFLLFLYFSVLSFQCGWIYISFYSCCWESMGFSNLWLWHLSSVLENALPSFFGGLPLLIFNISSP